MNSEGFRETLSEERQREPKKAKMAGKKEAKQKAGPRGQTEKNREEAESSAKTKNTSEGGGQRAAQSMQQRTPQRKETQRDPKGQGEPKKPGMTKRRQVRKVATMVKRLKKNPEDSEQQLTAEAGAGLASEGGWDAQQQATVASYAHSRGMQPREVLQALVNSMEKILRKEKGEKEAQGKENRAMAIPSGSSRGILHEINQQYLRLKYTFKEGAPLKEYLRQRVPNLGDTCTLWEVLTWLKEIIRDNLLFDESNPAMIVGDAPLEATLRKKRVHVNEILGVQCSITAVDDGGSGSRSLKCKDVIGRHGLRGDSTWQPAPGGPGSDDSGQHHQHEGPEHHGNSGRPSRAVQSSTRQQLTDHQHGLVHTPAAGEQRFSSATACGRAERRGSACCNHTGGIKLHRGSSASAEPRARCPKRTRA